ncbi:MAG: protein-glutamate O-methyltransferase CheR, partial [Planctomycetota bacterium]|nr:protein-glutamate O-methyltransferase CheR [Planctomycetota bacterium]
MPDTPVKNDKDSKPRLGEHARLFSGFIEKNSGLSFTDEQAVNALESSLLIRMQDLGIRNFIDYYDLLIMENDPKAEIRALLELLTINETSFFRNLPQFEAFQEFVLPRLLESRGHMSRTLRIWCAGCASGEEPYTLAMILQSHLPQDQTWDFDIYATDISQRALSTARHGVYTKRSVRSTPESYLSTFFIAREDGTYEIHKSIKDSVSFGISNLVSELPPVPGPFDVIFCRNVIIYFSKTTIEQILSMFNDYLAHDGYLFVGHSENISNFSDAFQPT